MVKWPSCGCISVLHVPHYQDKSSPVHLSRGYDIVCIKLTQTNKTEHARLFSYRKCSECSTWCLAFSLPTSVIYNYSLHLSSDIARAKLLFIAWLWQSFGSQILHAFGLNKVTYAPVGQEEKLRLSKLSREWRTVAEVPRVQGLAF